MCANRVVSVQVSSRSMTSVVRSPQSAAQDPRQDEARVIADFKQLDDALRAFAGQDGGKMALSIDGLGRLVVDLPDGQKLVFSGTEALSVLLGQRLTAFADELRMQQVDLSRLLQAYERRLEEPKAWQSEQFQVDRLLPDVVLRDGLPTAPNFSGGDQNESRLQTGFSSGTIGRKLDHLPGQPGEEMMFRGDDRRIYAGGLVYSETEGGDVSSRLYPDDILSMAGSGSALNHLQPQPDDPSRFSVQQRNLDQSPGPLRPIDETSPLPPPVPRAEDDVYRMLEDGVLTGDLFSNDLVPGSTRNVELVGNPPQGTLVIRQDGTFSYVPPTHFAGVVSFTYSYTDERTGQLTQAEARITIDPVVDPGRVDVPAAPLVALEDTPVLLQGVGAGLVDTDLSETARFTITGVPPGATFAGSGTDLGNGVWVFTATEMAGPLLFSPPGDFSGVVTLLVVAATRETATGESVTVSRPFSIDIVAVADVPRVADGAVRGFEDSAIRLGPGINYGVSDADGSENVSSVEIMALPPGWLANFPSIPGVTVTPNIAGGFLIAGPSAAGIRAQLDGFTITPPLNADADIRVSFVVRTADANGSVASASAEVSVTVDAAADMPVLSAIPVVASEDAWINLGGAITLATPDTDGSEAITRVEITGFGTAMARWTAIGGASVSVVAGGYAISGGSEADILATLASFDLLQVANSDADIPITVSAQSTDTGGVVSAFGSVSLPVTVRAIADAPVITTTPVSGAEDTAIGFGASLTWTKPDNDGSEWISTIEISAFPPGWVVAFVSGAAVTVTGGANGPYVLSVATRADEAALRAVLDTFRVTPPLNADADAAIAIRAQSTDNDGSTAWGAFTPFAVNVRAVADPASVTGAATGNEDTVIALPVTVTLADADGSETVVAVEIGAIPAGAVLGWNVGLPGIVTLLGTGNVLFEGSPAQIATLLQSLTIRPPANSDADFQLTVRATVQETNPSEAGDVALLQTINLGFLPVIVTAVADLPDVTGGTATTPEDTAVVFGTGIAFALNDTDGSETITQIGISGVPAGAFLSWNTALAGTVTTPFAGTWAISGTPAQIRALLDTFAVTPALHNDSDFSLSVTATVIDNDGQTASRTITHAIIVTPVADAPTASVGAGAFSTAEDIPVLLTGLGGSLVDADLSETLGFRITGIPANRVSFTTGTEISPGVWEFTPAEILAGIIYDPPVNFAGDVAFTLTVISRELSTGGTAQTSLPFTVTVGDRADLPVIAATSSTGSEDVLVPFGPNVTYALSDTDGSEVIARVAIGNIPAGAVVNYLVVGTATVTLVAGRYVIEGPQADIRATLDSFALIPPANSDANIALSIAVTSREVNGDEIIATAVHAVVINAIADAPVIAGSAFGTEDAAIAVPVTVSLVDGDGSESLVLVEVTGVPAGATLAYDTGLPGTVTALATGFRFEGTTAQIQALLASLAITPALNSDADFSLNVLARTQETSPSEAGEVAVPTADRTFVVPVTVTAVADVPTVGVGPVTGLEDTAITFGTGITLMKPDGDGSEWVSSVEIAAFPAGWAVAFTGNAAVTVTGTGSGPYVLSIAGKADEAALRTVLDTFRVTPPLNSDADATVNVRAQSTDNDGSVSPWSAASALGLVVNPVSDIPVLATLALVVNEDTLAVFGNRISWTKPDNDGSERISEVQLAGLPTGAGTLVTWTVSGGAVVTSLGGGAYTITGPNEADIRTTLDTFALRQGTNLDTDFVITARARTIDGTAAASAFDVATLNVTVTAVADVPTVGVGPVTGLEDTAITFGTGITLMKPDGDGSEWVSSVEIAAFPAGWAVAFTGNAAVTVTGTGSGPYVLSIAGKADEAALRTVLDTFRVTPPLNSDADATVNVRAQSTDNDGSVSPWSAATALGLVVRAVADAPAATAANASGPEDTFIGLTLTSAVSADTDGSETTTVQITGVPAGGTFSAGASGGAGIWNLTAAQLAGLSFRPPAQANGNFNMNLVVTSTEVATGAQVAVATSVTSVPFTVTATAVLDNITLGPSSQTLNEDSAINVGAQFTINLADLDGSQSLTYNITGIPAGYTVSRSLTGLTTYTDLGGGAVRFSGPNAGDVITSIRTMVLNVTGVAINKDANFTLGISATTVETGGASSSATGSHAVTVRAVADAPTNGAPTALVINEDPGSNISFPITAVLVDTDGSEVISRVDVTITTVATHNPTINYNTGLAGTKTAIANGWRFEGTTAQIQALLASVTLTPVTNNGLDIGVRVASTARESNPTEAGDVATPTATRTSNFTINMVPVADTPTVAAPGIGSPFNTEEDQRVRITGLGGALVDTDGSETLTFQITGAPTGAVFQNTAGAAVGTFAAGTWTFTPAQITAGIWFLPPGNFSGTSTMNFISVSTETEVVANRIATNTAQFRVIVDSQADVPTVSGTTIGNEDTSINFGVNVITTPTDMDGSEYISRVVLAGFTAGWAVTYTPNVNVTVVDSGTGTFTLSVASPTHAAALQTVLDTFRATPPAQSDANLTITVTATSTDADASFASSAPINHLITVRAVADAPVANASASTGDEDAWIDTNLSLAASADADGSEILSARIFGVPAGATLQANTLGGGTFVNSGGGIWTITAPTTAQLNTIVQSVQFRHAINLSGPVVLQLEVTATETATGGELATASAVTTSAFTVTVAGVADVPTLHVVDATGGAAGYEDSLIALLITPQLNDTDGSETITARIGGVPTGATFATAGGTPVGTNAGGGIWTFTAAELSGLHIRPPANSNVDFTLNITIRATETAPVGNPGIGDFEEASSLLQVQVIGIADTPTLNVPVINATEDQPIQLGLAITGALADTDGSEVIFYVLSGLPAGVQPSVGTFIGGEWQITAAQLPLLTIPAPVNFSGNYTATFAPALRVRAVAQEDDGNQTSVSAALNVVVEGVMDGFGGWSPSVQVTEDSDISFSNAAFSSLPDNDGSETIQSYTFDLNGVIAAARISGVVPNVATLISSHITGTFTNNGNGTITVLAGNLPGVAFRNAAFRDANVDFAIPVIARVVESGGLTQDVSGTYAVDLVGDADTPTAFAQNVSAVTGQLTALNPTGAEFGGAITDTDAALGRPSSERIYYIVSGAPGVLGTDVAFFKPGGELAGLNNNDGTWYLSPADLVGLQITSRYGFTGTVNLELTVVTVENDGDLATSAVPASFTATFTPDSSGSGGNITPVTPTISITPITTAEDGNVVFSVQVSQGSGENTTIPDPTVSLFISGLMPGARVTGAVINPNTGRYIATADDLAAGLVRIIPPLNYSGTMAITVEAVAMNTQLNTATTGPRIVNVTVTPVADGPSISAAPAAGQEDVGTLLNIGIGFPDSVDRTPGTANDDTPEMLTGLIRVSVDNGASLSAGTLVSPGVYDLTLAQLAGLRLVPAANWHGTVAITVAATGIEPDSGATRISTSNFNVVIRAAADTPNATALNSTGAEDGVIGFGGLSATLVDTDGSEVLSVKIRGIPEGSILSAGANNGDGSWTIPTAALAALTIRPPKDYSGTMSLTLEAYALDADGSTATRAVPFTITVTPVADIASIDPRNVTGTEDNPLALNLNLLMSDTTGLLPGENTPETVEITFSNVDLPAGFAATGGTVTKLDATTWRFMGTKAQSDTLRYTAGNNTEGLDVIAVSVVSVDGASRSAAVNGTFTADVQARADAPLLFASPMSGAAGSIVPLNIEARLSDTDGSETLSSVTLAGVPLSAILSAGNNLGGGTWSLTQADLVNLNITLPAGQTTFSMTASVASTETSNLHSTTTSQGLTVTIGAAGSVITGDTFSNALRGGVNADTISGGDGNDSLSGNDGNDQLLGGAGADTLIGGNGADTLIGGAGIDLLTGGAGSDRLVWQAGHTGGGADQVTDFNVGQNDRLDISGILNGYSGGSLTGFVQFVSGGGNTTINIDANGGSSFSTSLAVLQGVTGLNVETLRLSGHLIA